MQSKPPPTSESRFVYDSRPNTATGLFADGELSAPALSATTPMDTVEAKAEFERTLFLKVKAGFEAYDADQSGFLDAAELPAVFEDGGLVELLRKAEILYLFDVNWDGRVAHHEIVERMDRDHDGKVSLDEFLGAVVVALQLHMDVVKLEKAQQAAAAAAAEAAAAAVKDKAAAEAAAAAEAEAEAEAEAKARKGKRSKALKRTRRSKPVVEPVAPPEHVPFQLAPLWEEDDVLDALDDANELLSTISKSELLEIRGYHRPPALVGAVMEAVMILRGCRSEWLFAKKEMGDQFFLSSLLNFDKDRVPRDALAAVEPYVYSDVLEPAAVAKTSMPAAAMCLWVRAIYCYARQQPMLCEAARMRAEQVKLQSMPKRVPRERLVYMNGGSELVKVDSLIGSKDFGRQRVVPGIRVTQLESAETRRVDPALTLRRTKRPTPPKEGTGVGGRTLRLTRTQPGGILTKRAIQASRRAAAKVEPYTLGFGRRVGAPDHTGGIPLDSTGGVPL